MVISVHRRLQHHRQAPSDLNVSWWTTVRPSGQRLRATGNDLRCRYPSVSEITPITLSRQQFDLQGKDYVLQVMSLGVVVLLYER